MSGFKFFVSVSFHFPLIADICFLMCIIYDVTRDCICHIYGIFCPGFNPVRGWIKNSLSDILLVTVLLLLWRNPILQHSLAGFSIFRFLSLYLHQYTK